MVPLKTLLAVALMIPATVRPQASAYVPTDDIAYAYVDALIARGMLPGLSALDRPFTVNRIRDALDSTSVAGNAGVVASYVTALRALIGRYDLRSVGEATSSRSQFRAKATFDIYATAQTSARRELMVSDSRDDVSPAAGGYFVMGGGHLAGSVRAILDNRLNADPEFTGGQDRPIAGRTEDAYIGGQWKYGELSFGRIARSWGPAGFSGLLLGDDAYTYDHLFGRAGTKRFNISTVIAKLENYVLTPGVESSRYFSAHRLAVNRGRFEMALSESFVYSGVGRGLEFSLLNPLNVYGLSWKNERTDGNLAFGFEAAFRSRTRGLISGQLLLDDVQIDKCDTVCREPSAYGLTLAAEGLPAIGDQRLFASYTRVSNLAYRTPNVAERYAIYGVGLGRGYSDYDELRLGVDLAILPRAPLRVYVARRRQGEGDYRNPYPAPSLFDRTPGILSGTVWTTNRIGVTGSALLFRDFQLSADAGVNQSANRSNRQGYDISIFEGRARVTWVPRWLVRFE
ncbi:MAG: hypothetical protein ABIR58_02520 [Gemmatimonadaceae bacterium]